jgi:uncharacterized membrane protein
VSLSRKIVSPQTTSPQRVGLAVVVLFFGLGGLAHFVFATTEKSIIPPFVPFPDVVNYLTGVFEIAGAIGLLIPRLRRLAAGCLVLLTVCVTPANVFMLVHADRFPTIPEWVLVARLPLQLVLVLLIAWSGGLFSKR